MIKTYEYVLWNNCTMSCKFCNLKYKHQSTLQEQIDSIRSIEKDLDLLFQDDSEAKFNLLFVGGEIFNKLPSVLEELLYSLYTKVFENNKVNIIYFNTNLLYKIDNDSLLVKVLNKAKSLNKLRKIHFTTSDDYVGRFSSEEQKNLLYSNIDYLNSNYSQMNIISNMIMTKPFCNDTSFNIREYIYKHNVKVTLLPYIDLNKDSSLKPSKDEVTKKLFTIKLQYPEWFEGYVETFLINKNIVVQQYNPKLKRLEDLTEYKKICKHNINFKNCFSDSDECFLCFLENFR